MVMNVGAMLQAAANSSFAVRSQDGCARVGRVVTKHGVVDSPNSLAYTRRGNPLSLTPDMLEQINPEVQALQVNVMHFLEHPSPGVLRNYGKGGHDFLGLSDYVMVATNRDPTMYEYGIKPSTNEGVYVTIHSGGYTVTPSKYMEVIDVLRPDLYVSLCDEVTSDSKKKRVVTSVDRTLTWLDDCLAAHVQQASGAMILAAVAGGGIMEERTRAAQGAAEKAVDGFALCGFGTGEPPSERPALMRAALQPLPEDKVRLVSGLHTPEELLEAVAEGIDLFDSGYIAAATAAGCALAFALAPGDGQPSPVAAADPERGSDDTKLNLWSPEYRQDKSPLVVGCSCFACRHHSRAYLHHLLNCHEILADVLLEMHNTQHMQAFFAEIRAAIAAGRFTPYREWFVSQRRNAQRVSMPPVQ